MHLLVRIHFSPELQNVLQLALQMVLSVTIYIAPHTVVLGRR
jgi:hypothetical protein